MTTEWTTVREHTKSEEATYGAAVFMLLHWRTEREQRKANALARVFPSILAGRAVDNLPEARRVYLALCKRLGRAPEAVRACVHCCAETSRLAYVAHLGACTCAVPCRKVLVCEACDLSYIVVDGA